MPDFGDIDPNTGQTNERTGYGALDPNAPSVANGQITPAQWAEYRSRRKRDAVLGFLGILGSTVGLGLAGQALTGGGALASASGGSGASGAAGALPPVAGGAPWPITPFAGTATMAPTGAAAVGGTIGAGAAGAGAAGAAGAGGGGILGNLKPSDLLAIGTSLAGTYEGLRGAGGNNNPTTATTDPALAELISIMSGRLRKSEPLHDSILAMADGLLPMQYQRGGQGRG